MPFKVGIDVGGTFTDAVVVDQAGEIFVFKSLTIHEKPTLTLLNCLTKAATFLGVPLAKFIGNLERLTYGTTIAANALIQGRLARTGLITTKGFKDTLPIARIGREYLTIDLQVEPPIPLTGRDLIHEVNERVDYTGKILVDMSEEEVKETLGKLAEQGVEAIAACLLWAQKNPAHEQKISELVRRKLPDLYLSISSEVAPMIGEYERTATVVMNAGLGPVVSREFSGFVGDLKEHDFGCPLLLMQSNGGVIPFEDCFAKPITLINSGPAGGTIAAKYLGEKMGLRNIICTDMGGTSFDVSLVTEGQYPVNLESRVKGHSIFLPTIDILSIGAGGGSIAWLDMGTRLKVGPASAGASPGPACYGRGGWEPTVTDANVVLNRIAPQAFLGGEMPLNRDLATKAIEEKLAQPLGMDTADAALGICRIVDANMADAIRLVTVEKGRDPRDFVLMAFGGAGPIHAPSLARELGIGTIVVPYMATALSAFGITSSDILHSLAYSDTVGLDDVEKINIAFQRLEQQGRQLLLREGVHEEQIQMDRFVDMRYCGQYHEVIVSIPHKRLYSNDLSELVHNFEAKYQSLYGKGTTVAQAGFEIATFRVSAIGRLPKPLLRYREVRGREPSSAFSGAREVYFGEDGKAISTNVYKGEKLEAGNEVEGPAIVEYWGTTAIVYPGQLATVDPYLNLIIKER